MPNSKLLKNLTSGATDSEVVRAEFPMVAGAERSAAPEQIPLNPGANGGLSASASATDQPTIGRHGQRNRPCMFYSLLLTLILLLPACNPQIKPDIPAPPPAPHYTDLVNQYNANIAGFTKLWSKDTIILRGHKKHGTGKDDAEANLIIDLPDNLALVIDKLGNRIIWAGSNQTHYWFFDFENDTLYQGRHDKLNPQTAEQYPLPIHPKQLPSLLGLLAIDPNHLPPEPAVESYPQGFVIEPPDTGMRLLLDHETALPKRIDLIDETGGRTIICLLSKHKPLTDKPAPVVPTFITIKLVDRPEQMTLKLGRLSTSPRKIKAKQFDLGRLVKAFKPETTIDLDK